MHATRLLNRAFEHVDSLIGGCKKKRIMRATQKVRDCRQTMRSNLFVPQSSIRGSIRETICKCKESEILF